MPILRRLAAVLLLLAPARPALRADLAPPVLTVTATIDQAGPYTPGETLTIHFTVTNPGAATAENILVEPTATNLVLQPLAGPCKGQPCIVPYLRKGQQAVFLITGFIAQGGDFKAALSASIGTANHPVSAAVEGVASSPAANPGGAQPSEAQLSGAQANPNIQPAAASAAKQPPPAEAPAALNPPPQAPPAEAQTGKPGLTVQGQLTSAGPYQAGQSVTLLFQITNRGNRAASRLLILGTPENLTLPSTGTGCSAKPCSLASLAPGTSHTIKIGGVIGSPGVFGYSIRVASSTPGVLTAVSEVTASAPAAPPTLPIWIWAAALVGVMAVVGGLVFRAVRPVSLGVTSSVDPAACTATCGPLSFAAPPIHLQASLAPPVAGESTHIPILRKEILRD